MQRPVLAVAVTLALAAALCPVAATAAPRDRDLIIDVRPRSFLDPGTGAPVGSRSRYVFDTMPRSASTPFYGFQNQSDLPLPDRFSSGRGYPFPGR